MKPLTGGAQRLLQAPTDVARMPESLRNEVGELLLAEPRFDPALSRAQARRYDLLVTVRVGARWAAWAPACLHNTMTAALAARVGQVMRQADGITRWLTDDHAVVFLLVHDLTPDADHPTHPCLDRVIHVLGNEPWWAAKCLEPTVTVQRMLDRQPDRRVHPAYRGSSESRHV